MRVVRPFLFGSDLDGTLLPNGRESAPEGCLGRTRKLLQLLEKEHCPVCFVSGRHLELAQKARTAFKLPRPDYWVCNVGSEIYSPGGRADGEWSARLGPVFNHSVMWAALTDIPGLQPQEREKQGPHKFSLYYDSSVADDLQGEIQSRMKRINTGLQVVYSVDVFTNRGLVDVLPTASGKSQALAYLAEKHGLGDEAVFFSGDSGNDTDALTQGFCGTLVGNAPAPVRQEVQQAAGERAHLYLAQAHYGDGIIEGLCHFGLVEE